MSSELNSLNNTDVLRFDVMLYYFFMFFYSEETDGRLADIYKKRFERLCRIYRCKPEKLEGFKIRIEYMRKENSSLDEDDDEDSEISCLSEDLNDELTREEEMKELI